MVNFQALEMQY